jgi:hypothetical protein
VTQGRSPTGSEKQRSRAGLHRSVLPEDGRTLADLLRFRVQPWLEREDRSVTLYVAGSDDS